MSRQARRSGLGSFYARGRQLAIELQALIDHALRGEALAGAGVGEFRIGAAHGAILVQQANVFGEALGVVGAEVESGVSPDLAEAGNIVGDDRAAGERGFESG